MKSSTRQVETVKVLMTLMPKGGGPQPDSDNIVHSEVKPARFKTFGQWLGMRAKLRWPRQQSLLSLELS